MKKLCIFFCFASVMIFGRDVSLSLEAIDIDTQHSGTSVVITLSNGTTWKKFISPENESQLLKLEQSLQVGEQVSVYTILCDPKIFISKKGKLGSGFGPSKETKAALPKIITLERIEIEPAGWFSSAKYGYELKLSDGSVWKSRIGLHSTWQEGHSILIGTEMKDGQYSLIDLDASHAVPLIYGAKADFRQLYWTLKSDD